MSRIVLLFTGCLVLATAHAASFNCAKTQLDVEKMICANHDLLKLDEASNMAYTAALQDKKQTDAVQQAQKQWLKMRNGCLDADCVRSVYEEHLEFLRQFSTGTQADCFDQIANKQSSYDIYAGVGSNGGASVQAPGPGSSLGPGLTGKAVVVVRLHVNSENSQLCYGNNIEVWLPEPSGKFPAYLTAHLVDEHFNSLAKEFRVSETEEPQLEHAVAALLDGGFVVTWKSDKATEHGKHGPGAQIRGRVFESSGKPRGRSFNVSSGVGENGQASVYSLPNGSFAVMWTMSQSGVYLRVFDSAGVAKTKSIQVAVVKSFSEVLIPYGYITRGGQINIFMAADNDHDAYSFFRFARTYNLNGEPLTALLTGDELQKVDGYQSVVARIAHQHAAYYN